MPVYNVTHPPIPNVPPIPRNLWPNNVQIPHQNATPEWKVMTPNDNCIFLRNLFFNSSILINFSLQMVIPFVAAPAIWVIQQLPIVTMIWNVWFVPFPRDVIVPYSLDIVWAAFNVPAPSMELVPKIFMLNPPYAPSTNWVINVTFVVITRTTLIPSNVVVCRPLTPMVFARTAQIVIPVKEPVVIS